MTETKDWLTGLYNRAVVEQKVNAWLQTGQGGTLFVLDVDNFKGINDRYGHIVGDRVLQEIARLLTRMVQRTDILGRVEGDAFVIFMPVRQETGWIDARCRQIEQRFGELPRERFYVNRLSLTACGSSDRAGDDYQSLFDRAVQGMLRNKAGEKREPPVGSSESLKTDMEQISRKLSEPGEMSGAYCQDYDSFVSIYRFTERRLRRMRAEVYTLLFTLTDERGDFPPLQERGGLMEALHESIQSSIRLGDVFTRYSSCQYLVMVCDATDVQTDAIAERIQRRYGRYTEVAAGMYQLIYHRYPLKPAMAKKEHAAETDSQQKAGGQDEKGYSNDKAQNQK